MTVKTNVPYVDTITHSVKAGTLSDGRMSALRREYNDGIVVIMFESLRGGSNRYLVFDRATGTRGGFLWVGSLGPGQAAYSFRRGQRATEMQEIRLHRG